MIDELHARLERLRRKYAEATDLEDRADFAAAIEGLEWYCTGRHCHRR